eukprot:SAG11_NODE_16616_length_542_cov_1.510158_1_plen_48_part_01
MAAKAAAKGQALCRFRRDTSEFIQEADFPEVIFSYASATDGGRGAHHV